MFPHTTATPKRISKLLLGLLPVMTAWSSSGHAADWPQWRGVERNGRWDGVRLPERFSEEVVTKRWRVPVGGGYSGIAVARGRVFTMDRQGETERVLCLEAETGKRHWAHTYEASYGDLDHDNGPRATPTVLGDEVFTVGAMGHILALDAASGKVLWRVDTVEEYQAKLPIWGQAASALVDGDMLFVQVGARPDGTLVALDRASGKERWRALADRPGYSSPIIVEVDGKRQLILWTADRAVGARPANRRAALECALSHQQLRRGDHLARRARRLALRLRVLGRHPRDAAR